MRFKPVSNGIWNGMECIACAKYGIPLIPIQQIAVSRRVNGPPNNEEFGANGFNVFNILKRLALSLKDQ
jgi:hypothetical protein